MMEMEQCLPTTCMFSWDSISVLDNVCPPFTDMLSCPLDPLLAYIMLTTSLAVYTFVILQDAHCYCLLIHHFVSLFYGPGSRFEHPAVGSNTGDGSDVPSYEENLTFLMI